MKRPIVDVDDALLCFADTERAARRRYSSAMKAGVDEVQEDDATSLTGFRSLRWRDRTLEPKPGQEHVDVVGRSTGRARPLMTAETFVEGMCELLGIEVDQLASRSRSAEIAELRRIVATLGVERWGLRGTDLGRVLNKNPDVVSWWVGQGIRRRLEDQDFAERLDTLDVKLASGPPREAI